MTSPRQIQVGAGIFTCVSIVYQLIAVIWGPTSNKHATFLSSPFIINSNKNSHLPVAHFISRLRKLDLLVEHRKQRENISVGSVRGYLFNISLSKILKPIYALEVLSLKRFSGILFGPNLIKSY